MSFINIPIKEIQYFDTHMHSVDHGASEMSGFEISNVYNWIDACVEKGLKKISLTEHVPFAR